MSRTLVPFETPDVSALARALGRELAARERLPGHVELLNMLSRSAGYRNFQHLRADRAARDKLERAPVPPEPVDHVRVARLARHFDAAGALVRLPTKLSERMLCLWVLWSRFPRGEAMTEKQVNQLLCAHHRFGDPATLRRELVEAGHLARPRDCSEYRRIERPPPSDAAALIRHVWGRVGTQGG